MGCIFGEGRFLENHEDDSLDVEGNQLHEEKQAEEELRSIGNR